MIYSFGILLEDLSKSLWVHFEQEADGIQNMSGVCKMKTAREPPDLGSTQEPVFLILFRVMK